MTLWEFIHSNTRRKNGRKNSGNLKERFGRDLDNCTKSEIFEALMVITKQEMAGRKKKHRK